MRRGIFLIISFISIDCFVPIDIGTRNDRDVPTRSVSGHLPLFAAHNDNLEESVKEYTLDNGLRVLFVERHESPTFAAFTLFPSGRVDEPKEKAGIAHIVEHMLFKGTETIGTKDYEKESVVLAKLDSLGSLLVYEKSRGIPDSVRLKELGNEFKEIEEEAANYVIKNELGNVYEREGAHWLNAGTSMDGTMYMVQLPSNRLELWARITADIIENTIFREFYKEKAVVMNEIRMRKDEPEGVFWNEFMALAFKVHPYGKPIAGEVKDIENLTIKDIKDFYNMHYVLSNAIIGIVGDLNWEEVKKITDKYYAHFPKLEHPESIVEKEPEQIGERRKVIELDAEPRIAIGYHVPTYPEQDAYVLNVMSGILSRGRTSRLYKRLVENSITTSADTYSGTPGMRYPNLFVFEGEPITPHITEEIETMWNEEIEKLKNTPVSEFELRKVKNQVKANFLRRLQSNLRVAMQFVYFEGYFGGWEKVYEYIEMIDKVTKEDIIGVANKYFTMENRTIVSSVRKATKGKELIDLAVEYYKEKAGKEPDEEIINQLKETLEQIKQMEKAQGITIPREQKLQGIKQAIDALTGGER